MMNVVVLVVVEFLCLAAIVVAVLGIAGFVKDLRR